MRYAGLLIIISAMAGSAMADDVSGTRASHPVIRAEVDKLTLDCVVRPDLGLRDCVVVKATPLAHSKAPDVIKMFETRVHVPASGAAVGQHRQFSYSWQQDA